MLVGQDSGSTTAQILGNGWQLQPTHGVKMPCFVFDFHSNINLGQVPSPLCLNERIVFGQNIWYKLLPLDTPLLSLLKHTTCSERLSWFRDPRHWQAEHQDSRRNVFLQVRSVDKISIRFKGIWKTSRTALTLDWLISETLIARVASS